MPSEPRSQSDSYSESMEGSGNTTTVVAALFRRRSDAEEAIADLLGAGFKQDKIQLGLAGEKNERTQKQTSNSDAIVPRFPVAPASSGDVEGMQLVPMHMLPAEMATLKLEDEDARLFHEQMGKGSALLVVDAGSHAEIARMVLERNGGNTRPGR